MVNATPSTPPVIAIATRGQYLYPSQAPMITSAGMVKMMPATSDSPADAAVWTRLFSRMLERLKARSTPIETAAAGIEADTCVRAAGAGSGELGELIGFELPVEPLSRDCYHFKCEQELEPLPLIKTEKDLGIRPEPDGFSGGLPDWRRGPGWSFNEVGGFFEETFWPLLAELMPAFETLKLLNTWQGHYARNHFDLTAIIGPWSGGMENVYVATGYSGHGIMQAPATGRAIAELILDGGFQTLDLTNMGYARVPANKPYREQGII